jgi:phosphatidylserine/phosphatidylglycerophosphate/cardiolipin synthase-like enzyme
VTGSFSGLSPSALRELGAAIEAGTIGPPFSALSVGRLGLNASAQAVAVDLQTIADLGATPGALARMLVLLASERTEAQHAADRTELVWTGPETRGARTRDTAVVARELFSVAARSVLISTYALYDGRTLFEALVQRMVQVPDLRVRVFLNVTAEADDASGSHALHATAEMFERHHWSGERYPEIFYDPRSLRTGAEKAVLHAKVIAVDDTYAFVTSANFTEAGHDRNIEAGVLVRSPGLATSLRLQFDGLVQEGVVKRLALTR